VMHHRLIVFAVIKDHPTADAVVFGPRDRGDGQMPAPQQLVREIDANIVHRVPEVVGHSGRLSTTGWIITSSFWRSDFWPILGNGHSRILRANRTAMNDDIAVGPQP